jgi:hypothetical protein
VISSRARAADLEVVLSAGLGVAMSVGTGEPLSADLEGALSAGSGAAMLAGLGEPVSAGLHEALSAGSGAALAVSAVFLEADSRTRP